MSSSIYGTYQSYQNSLNNLTELNQLGLDSHMSTIFSRIKRGRKNEGSLIIVSSNETESKIIRLDIDSGREEVELGHALGLKHSYYNTDLVNGCTNISNIPGTPDCDFNSIMGYNTGGNTFSFSSYDILAAKYLFPDPPQPQISGPNYMGFGTDFITWTYDGGITNAQSYKWFYKKTGTNGLAYMIGYNSPNLFFSVGADTIYSSGKNSYFEIYLEVTDTNGGKFTSNTYSILKKGKWKYVDN